MCLHKTISLLAGLAALTIATPSCRSAETSNTAPGPHADVLHPKLRWLTEQKVRGIWIGGGLDQPFGDTDKTKGRVLADAGFNLVVLYTGVDRKNRDTAPDLADRLRRNLAVT